MILGMVETSVTQTSPDQIMINLIGARRLLSKTSLNYVLVCS